jgi:hypothetical protein
MFQRFLLPPSSLITLMMKAASMSEMSVKFFSTTWCNNPEDSYLHTFFIVFVLLSSDKLLGTVTHSFKSANLLTKTKGASSITVSFIYSAFILPYHWCVVWSITSSIGHADVFRLNILHYTQLIIMMARPGTKTMSSLDMNWGECCSDLPCLSSLWVAYR